MLQGDCKKVAINGGMVGLVICITNSIKLKQT